MRRLAVLVGKVRDWSKESTSEQHRFFATGADFEAFNRLRHVRFSWLSTTEAHFIDQSVEEANRLRRRTRTLLYTSIASSILLAIALAIAAASTRLANEQRTAAIDLPDPVPMPAWLTQRRFSDPGRGGINNRLVQAIECYAHACWITPNNIAMLGEMTIDH
jgi:hypothetical protein